MFKLKDRETKLQCLQEDVDQLQNKLRDIKEECAEKDGQMKVISMNFASVEKQRNHLADEVRLQFIKIFWCFSILLLRHIFSG